MKIITEGKIDPSIKESLKKLVTTNIEYYVVGGLLCQYYLKDHARFTKDIDIVFYSDKKTIEEELKKAYGEINFFYEDERDSFYEPSFTCFSKVNNLLCQVEGKKIHFFPEIKYEEYIYEGITFKGIQIEYVISEKVISVLNELARPYKHLVDLYSFSKIDESLIDKKEIYRIVHLINDQENRYRKEHGLKEYKLPKKIPSNKEFAPPFMVPTLQSKYNVSKKEMIKSVNKWLKQIL